MKNTHDTTASTTSTERNAIQQFFSQLKFPLVAALALLFIVACSKDDEGDTPQPGDITLTATTPDDNAINVLRSTTITATFSEAMNAETINEISFTLKKGDILVDGTVTYAAMVATFTPSDALEADTDYTATMSTQAKNADGKSLWRKEVWNFTTADVTASVTTIDLGLAGDFVILAQSAITNVPTSAITGDLGISPNEIGSITGFEYNLGTNYGIPVSQITGNIYAPNISEASTTLMTTATSNRQTAFTDGAGRPLPDFFELHTGILGGKTLSAGLYKWTNSVTIPTDMTITGTATDIWIFQIAGDLIQSSAVEITLAGQAKAENIFWIVTGEVVIGTNAHFEGIILCETQITLQTGASMNGRALAKTQVVLDQNTLVEPN